jgi:hypothetical protein
MDQNRVAEIYDELGQLLVELDPDPASRGPGYLQELVSRTRGYLNRTSVLTQEAHQQHQWLDRDLNAKKTAFQLCSDELLANDKRVTLLPNIDDRKAMINLLLRDDRQEIARLEQAIREVAYVEKAIRHRHKELDNTISAIRMQKSLIESESRTGSFYGDEGDTSRGDVYAGKARAAVSLDNDLDGDEIGRLLAESMGETGAKDEDTVAPETSRFSVEELSTPQSVGVENTEASTFSEKSVTDESEFDKFLQGDDLDDIFSGLGV